MKQDVSSFHATDDQDVWHLRVAYDGTDAYGWQVQTSVPTIQNELLQRLRTLFPDQLTRIIGTSRTDAGVHAIDQNVSFFLPGNQPLSPDKVVGILNRRLPPNIRVLSAAVETPDFNARFSPVGKSYVYCIHRGISINPFELRYYWQVPELLNIDYMRGAAEVLTGKHDFSSFAVNPKRIIESKVRNVHCIEISEQGPKLFIHVQGDSFLYKMIRSIVGYLVWVAKRKSWRPEDTARVLEDKDRASAAVTAPPQGLFLTRVFFSEKERLAYKPVLPPTDFYQAIAYDNG